MKKRGKRASILTENMVFMLLNLAFIIILILFIAKQGAGAIVLEQSYAKQIALLIDYSKPVMVIKLDMGEAMEVAKENGIIDPLEIVKINENIVTVKLSEKGGYSYAFFNDVEVVPRVEGEMYVFTIVK